MLFVVDYDRKQGRIVSFIKFDNVQRLEAENARLEIELHVDQSESNHEIVLLEAKDESALRESHSRYFDDLETLAAAGVSAAHQA